MIFNKIKKEIKIIEKSNAKNYGLAAINALAKKLKCYIKGAKSINSYWF